MRARTESLSIRIVGSSLPRDAGLFAHVVQPMLNLLCKRHSLANQHGSERAPGDRRFSHDEAAIFCIPVG